MDKSLLNYSIEELKAKVETYLSPEDVAMIMRAYELAEKSHKGQMRKTGEEYITHPLHVAYILADLNAAPEVVASGLLHDVVEDTEVTSEEITEQFGPTIARIVDGVTKLDQLSYNKNPLSRSEASNDNYQKLILAMVKDVRVVIVKLADRLHNMRTIKFLKPEKQKQIARETLDILAPLAHRLGMFKIKSDLEDLSFKVLQPQDYAHTLKVIEENKRNRQEALEAMIEKISLNLRSHNIKFTIKGRVKNVYSMYRKIQRANGVSSEIYDLLAIRILTDTIPDCYATLGYIHNMFTPMPKRIKDYIAVPKSNGYQSLHTTIFGDGGSIFEVQIRTYEMDYIAEYGVAAHWAYKEGKSVTDTQQQAEIQHQLKIFQELEDAINATEDENAEEFIDTVKHDIFDARVFAFTPTGDVHQLGKGATPIDFAYKIHTQVGNRMIGAKVNNRMVPISYEIQTGDIVEILTSPNGHPSEAWLRIATSSHAKSKIRSYFKKERREDNVETGKELLDEALKEKKLEFDDVFTEEAKEFIMNRFAFQGMEELYTALGQHAIGAKTIINRIIDFQSSNDDKLEMADSDKVEKVSEEHRKKIAKKSNDIVEVSGASNIRISLAKCCQPIPGDKLVGYISKGHGITVHRADCPQALRQAERHIDVVWAQDLPESKYIVNLQVISFDRKGLLSEIVQTLYKANTDIIDIQSKVESDNMVYTKLSLTAKDTEHLDKIFVAIRKVPDVYEIRRVIQ